MMPLTGIFSYKLLTHFAPLISHVVYFIFDKLYKIYKIAEDTILKLQQFFIFKFQSDRLKKSNFNINITLDDARINSEVITINNSSLIRTLFRYKKVKFSQNNLENLLVLQKKLRKAENTEKNRQKLIETTQEIEKTLFVEDLISVEFKHKSHYLNILKKKGFYVNGIRFTPFMASAGMIRRNTALFINNNIKYQLMDILDNGRDENVPMVNAKFGAYFSLYSSSTLPVSFPRIAVVSDKKIETIRRIDFVTYKGIDEDDDVTEKEYNLKTNAWDGQGLMTPRLALQWSDELELNYTFSCCIIRAPFTKGLVTVFDLDAFANKIAKTRKFMDIYGDEQDIGDIDLIISESMFKLFNAYKNTQDFVDKCKANELGFSIAKVNQKKEKSHSRTSYQFLQVLELNDWDIANLCEPTINWFRDISGNSPENMLLYATGEHDFDLKEFKKLDIAVKAILLNPSLARDKYIQNRFIKTITKKKKESYMGSILINANYQFMIADPFYQACHIFNIEHEPLLKDGEHYSEYWLNKGITKIGAIRSPIVHHSEFNILDLQERKDTRNWFQHIHSGIIFPANGIGLDCAIHGGADFDGDLICTINNKTMLKGKLNGIPIVYESQKAEMTIVDSRDDKSQVESQLNGYNSKVGFATNISSSMYTMLEEFPMGSDEQEAILKRLKIGRVIQGEIIDGVKGLKVPPFRDHWTKYKKITTDMTPEEIAKWEFNNKILCKVRPAFFRFLYPHYMTRYNKEIKKYNIYSHLVFKKSFGDILKARNRTHEEEEMVREYEARSFFLDNNSVVNRISRYMRANLGLIGKYSTKTSRDFDYTVLQNQNNILTQENIIKMRGYLQEYKTFKKTLRNNLTTSYTNLDAFISYLRKQCALNISPNEAELADYAIEVTYGEEVGMCEFPWKLFPEGLLDNIIQKSSGVIRMPIADEYGEIEYLWNRYSIKEFDLEDLYEEI
jgi:hypothetical protein